MCVYFIQISIYVHKCIYKIEQLTFIKKVIKNAIDLSTYIQRNKLFQNIKYAFCNNVSVRLYFFELFTTIQLAFAFT